MHEHWATFTVEGRPRTRGSKRGFLHRSTQKIVLVDMNKHSGSWMKVVRAKAKEIRGDGDIWAGPVRLCVKFVLQRPKSHLTSKGVLRSSAPLYPTSKACGDLDKFCRAFCDALTGECYVDDGQIISLVLDKEYGDTSRAEAEVYRVT